jgi:hypothetical protein
MKRIAVGLAVMIGLVGFGVGQVTAGMDLGPDRYQLTSDTRAPERLVVRGRGCLGSRDESRLRLVFYSAERVVYRCTTAPSP